MSEHWTGLNVPCPPPVQKILTFWSCGPQNKHLSAEDPISGSQTGSWPWFIKKRSHSTSEGFKFENYIDCSGFFNEWLSPPPSPPSSTSNTNPPLNTDFFIFLEVHVSLRLSATAQFPTLQTHKSPAPPPHWFWHRLYTFRQCIESRAVSTKNRNSGKNAMLWFGGYNYNNNKKQLKNENKQWEHKNPTPP